VWLAADFVGTLKMRALPGAALGMLYSSEESEGDSTAAAEAVTCSTAATEAAERSTAAAATEAAERSTAAAAAAAAAAGRSTAVAATAERSTAAAATAGSSTAAVAAEYSSTAAAVEEFVGHRAAAAGQRIGAAEHRTGDVTGEWMTAQTNRFPVLHRRAEGQMLLMWLHRRKAKRRQMEKDTSIGEKAWRNCWKRGWRQGRRWEGRR